MFDISAITPLVKWCWYSKKTSIGHYSPSEIKGIILDKVDVFLYLERDYFLKIKKKIIMQFNYNFASLRNTVSRTLGQFLIIKTFLCWYEHPPSTKSLVICLFFSISCIYDKKKNIAETRHHSVVTMPNSCFVLFASL